MKTAKIAFQIQVSSDLIERQQTYFVGADTEESAMEALRTSKSVPTSSDMRIVRSLGTAAIQQFEIGPGTIFRWV